eukprot:GHUV01013531.1.p2 GENE.GHUV01013531.1~~GHUV01013531.1.p2  ORF type:complete len:247 (+),score=56.62 GHUV01013531.1:1090-1830(+)
MPSSLERASGDGSSEEGPALDAKPPNGSSSKRGHASRGSGSSSGSGRHNKGGGSKGNLGKGGVSKVTKRPRQSKGASDDKSQLGRLICEGCNGLVLHGTFKGQPAVYKLFGPDRGGIAAGMNEASIYGALEPCQGTELPIFFEWGHLAAGIYYLAIACVEGVPCSELPSEFQATAALAAKAALQRICTVQPGFLHEDLRLENILFRHGSSDTAPTAVIIDLAASRLDGNPAEVKMQFRQLKSLFRR